MLDTIETTSTIKRKSPNMRKFTIACTHCGTPVIATRASRKFCSYSCSLKALRIERNELKAMMNV